MNRGSTESRRVEAAGGVVVEGTGSDRRVAVIHRPKWDDWSLPKGHREKDESLVGCALREVAEETGLHCRVIGEPVEIRYVDDHARAKRVTYWLMEPLTGSFAPNAEVDRMRWLERSDAAKLLSYEQDRWVLTQLW